MIVELASLGGELSEHDIDKMIEREKSRYSNTIFELDESGIVLLHKI